MQNSGGERGRSKKLKDWWQWNFDKDKQTYCKECRKSPHLQYAKNGESCEDCEYEEPYLFVTNRFFNKVYGLASFDRDAMSGTVHIQALRAIMMDFELSREERLEFYEKAMIVESCRVEANK